MPPVERFICRFAAEPPQEGRPEASWAQTLQAEFLAACLRIDAEGEDLGEAGDLRYFPDRSWNGRTYVPITAPTSTDLELYGYVSFALDSYGDRGDFAAHADFTPETAARNPDWQIDVCEEVIGAWRGDGGHSADMTLVWGTPLVRAARVATAELGGLAVDQCVIEGERFTLVAPDAYRADYLDVKLWDADGRELASESLYVEDDEGE